MSLIRHITAFLLPLTFPMAVLAQQPASPAETEEPAEDEVEISDVEGDDRSTLSGVVEIPGTADDIDIPIPAFVKQGANHITFNGADWGALRKDFEASGRNPVSIVLIGDSHVQADISSGTTRELLQYDFGNAGRGLVTPLKMSGTNQPADYTFTSRNSWIPNKLMSQSWRQTVGFTGLSIRPSSQTSELTIGTSDKEDYNPFTSLTIFHSGRLTVKKVTGEGGQALQFRAIPSHDYTQILLPSPQTRVTVDFSSAGDLTVFGASLSGDRPGLFYHAIGNNGAAYETYNRIGNVGSGIAPLKPSLVIISLGTNEAFGRLDTQAFTRAIDRLVKNIKAANPQAQILLTTPMECQKSVYTTKKVRVAGKARKGRKAKTRTVTRKTRSYAVNRNIAPLRQAILDYGRQNGVAVYDWYEVAGGQGASTKWVDKGLFAHDRVHHSRAGYTLEGRLLYEALLDGLRGS
ncbi:MAG: GDSL-type esterase/lipase family protein [Muribaculaceae bacterium]|nr:GDSL-type esterase/lipase family protein [Muribaculaceae bacterium]